jgi:hypothetical protein
MVVVTSPSRLPTALNHFISLPDGNRIFGAVPEFLPKPILIVRIFTLFLI